jgi:hypothetical protein
MLHFRRQARSALLLCMGILMAIAGPSRLSCQTTPPHTERHEVTEIFFGQT